MAKRTDEWELDRDGLNYCAKHHRYYLAGAGCQMCGYDNVLINHSKDIHLHDDNYILIKCKSCKKVSLMWNTKTTLYECLNIECKKIFAHNEIDSDNVILRNIVKQNDKESEISYDSTIKKINSWRSNFWGR
jgi:hypothetical protein